MSKTEANKQRGITLSSVEVGLILRGLKKLKMDGFAADSNLTTANAEILAREITKLAGKLERLT